VKGRAAHKREQEGCAGKTRENHPLFGYLEDLAGFNFMKVRIDENYLGIIFTLIK